MLADRFRVDITGVIHTITRPQFRDNYRALVDFMGRSLDARSDPERLLDLQSHMASSILALQASMREFADRGDLQPDEVRDLTDVCKALIYATRQIADGIAWRSLDYDRGAIHELAFAPHTGHLELGAMKSEIADAAARVAELHSVAIVNDLTNFLRYGDLTIVSPDSVWIHEVKAGRGSAKSGRATRQRQRRRRMVEFLNRRERRTEEGAERLVAVKARPRAHTRELAALIDGANNKGSAFARLSDAIAVDVLNVEVAAEAGPPHFHNPFRQSPRSSLFANIGHFGIFSPNVAPYSVFPLPPEQRIGLMTGRLLLFVYVNEDNLIRAFRRRGLMARLPTRQELDSVPKNLRPGDITKHEMRCPIVVGNASQVIHLSLAQLGRLSHELLDEESFVDAVCELLEAPRSEAESVYIAFEAERELWD